MSNKKTCKNCDSMRVKIPVGKHGRLQTKKSKAKCNNSDGILNRKNMEFNIGTKSIGHDYVDWKIYGKLCRQHKESNDIYWTISK